MINKKMKRSRAAAIGLSAILGLMGCNDSQADDGYKFMGISDIHYDYDEAKDKKSQYCFKCETTQNQLSEFEARAKAVAQSEKPDFIIVTGDLPGHRPWYNSGDEKSPSNRYGWTDAELEATAKKITVEFTQTFGTLSSIADDTGIPVIIAPGNNDAIGGDYCSFKNARPIKDLTHKNPFEFAPDPSNWPANNGAVIADKTHLDKGYYAIYPKAGSKLRILALNTVIFTKHYSEKRCVDDQQDDANTKIDWIAGQLDAAKTAGESVMMIMHVPPGSDAFGSTMWSSGLSYEGTQLSQYQGKWVQDVFLDLIGHHSGTVSSILTGHTHLNGIRRIHDCAGNFNELSLSIPGVTTDHGNQPGFKMFQTDGNYELTASDTYYATVNDYVSYDWASGNMFTFPTNYPCPECTGSETLKEQIHTISKRKSGKDDLLKDQWDYITLLRHKNYSPDQFSNAIDATCSANNGLVPR